MRTGSDQQRLPAAWVPACLLTCAILLLLLAPAHARIYKWTDRDGKVSFTDNIEAVPPAYRDQVEDKTSILPPLRPPEAPNTSPSLSPSPPASYAVPLHRVGNALFVDTTLNDSVKARLLLDTGATSTLISPALAQQLRLKPDDADLIPVQTANGSVLVPVTQVEAITVGGATVRDVDVVVHNAGGDGLLGMSFLSNFQVTINAAEGKMLLKTLPNLPGVTLYGGRPEGWWKHQFRFYRDVIAAIEAHPKQHPTSRLEKAQLEKTLRLFQQKLEALDRKATLAAVPRQWRY